MPTVVAARSGDRVAFDSLFARNLPRLVAFIQARVGGVVAAKESVQDLAQSVCLEALHGLEEFEYRGETSFRRWLFVRAVHKITNKYRWHMREKRCAAREVPGLLSDGDASRLVEFWTTRTPSQGVSVREQLLQIEAALQDLPEPQRDAITMTRVAGMSYQEAATELGRSESATRGLVMRGLARLSGVLDGEQR